MSDKDNKFYTVREVAERLNVHPQTIYRRLYNGKLSYWKIDGIIRIAGSDLNKFMVKQNKAEDKPNPPCLSRMIG